MASNVNKGGLRVFFLFKEGKIEGKKRKTEKSLSVSERETEEMKEKNWNLIKRRVWFFLFSFIKKIRVVFFWLIIFIIFMFIKIIINN